MSGDDVMSPLERLLNLVGLLLEADRPMTFDEIRRTLDAYSGENVESAKRKFERDKDILREYGVPLVMEPTDVWDVEQGYRIRKEDYYLPDIEFTPEEITALFVAAQGGSEETTAALGVRKLLFGADGGLLLGASGGPLLAGPDARSDRILSAAAAAEGHRRIGFAYRSADGTATERSVVAWGVVYRGGHWYLVGNDLDRDAVRAFRLSRCTSDLRDEGPDDPPPEGFDPVEHVSAGPWVAQGEDEAEVAFAPDAAVLASAQFRGVRHMGEREDRWPVLKIPSAGDEAMASLLLQFGPDAEVISPPSLRRTVIDRLREIADG